MVDKLVYQLVLQLTQVLVVVKHQVINLDKAKLVILKQRMVVLAQKVMVVPEVAGMADMHVKQEMEMTQMLAVAVDLDILDLE